MLKHSVTVRFGECDGLGHVNNGTYFTYMEDARVAVFRMFNPSLDLQSWNLIVASTRCDFLEQVTFAETIEIFTWISRIGNSSFVVDHALKNANGQWVARGQAVLICYDYETSKSAAIPESIRNELSLHRDGPEGAPEIR